MGNRLSKIYTRTGDKGSTGLGDGSRVAKNHPRMEVMGTLDEVNSHIGLLICELPTDDSCLPLLTRIQHVLFNVGSEAAVPGYTAVHDSDVDQLEQALDAMNDNLPPLKNFILPGGSKAAAQCHLARTVCRRAERAMVTLMSNDTGVNEAAYRYVNRLSDLLFVLARVLARRDGGSEILWDQPAP